MYKIDIWTKPLLHKQLTITGEQDLHELARNHYEEVKAKLGKMKVKHTFTEISDRSGMYIGESIVHMKDGLIHKPTDRTIYNFHTMHEARLDSYRTLKILRDTSYVDGFDDIRHLIEAENEEGSKQ